MVVNKELMGVILILNGVLDLNVLMIGVDVMVNIGVVLDIFNSDKVLMIVVVGKGNGKNVVDIVKL